MQTLFGFSGTLARYSYWFWSSLIHAITLGIIAISVASQGGLASMLAGGGTSQSTAMILIPIAANIYIQSALMVKRNRDAGGALWICHLYIGSLIFAGLQQGMQLSAGELGFNLASLVSGLLWTRLGMAKSIHQSAEATDAALAKPARKKLDQTPSLATGLLDPDVDLVARARELREQETAMAPVSEPATQLRSGFGKRAR